MRSTPRRGLHDRHGSPFVTLGDGVGARLTADASGYLGFGEDDRTVLAATRAGWRAVRRRYRSIPPDYLFYSGGSGTVRGQEYQSLGAIQNGIPSGGRSFGTLSAEVRQSLGDSNLGLVLFADAGYVGPMPGFRVATGTRARDRASAMTRLSARSASTSPRPCAAAAWVRTSSSISASDRHSDAPPDPFALHCLAALTLPVQAQDDDRGRLIQFLESQLSDGDDRQVRIDGFRGALSSEANSTG
jgi:hypothetical protein